MRTVRFLPPTLLSLLAAVAAPGDDTNPAAEAPIELATLEITAHPTGADERTAAVWVQRPDVSERPTSVGGLLNQIPGVHVDRAGGAGGRSTLYLRGGEENHTLVLLDGVPLNDPTNSRGGGVDLSLIDPAAVDSLALVRGPASMRHGPEAISGVLHLDTSAHVAPGHTAAIEGGGDGLGRAAFRSTLALGHDGDTATLGGTWHTEDAANDAGGLDRVFLHGGFHHAGPLEFSLQAWHLDN
ncbi:MAG: TonB-dependent receptor [Opitutaceae bacterium]|nr:TonB-dependent receptor [Opitutaceae bacterium]